MVTGLRPLERKLARDLWRLRGQVFAIAVVVASGVAVLVMSLGTHQALQETAAAYYERYRFAHVFTSVKRAPEQLLDRIARLPGVQAVEGRIVRLAQLDVAGFDEPIMGQLISIPDDREPVLNRLVLREGRFPRPGRPDEVVLNEPFAEVHRLHPGDRLQAVMNTRKRNLRVVGIALSPEFVYAIGPGALIPDDRRFGVLWMGRAGLAAAYDLEDAFNDLVLTLLRGVAPEPVIERLDVLLNRYGGSGAYDRSDQVSNWFLMNEIEQLRNLATILPSVFLAVTAFLTNIVLRRLITTERSEIGLLKAFGYSNWTVGWHYLKFVGAIAVLGIVLGWGVGWVFGQYTTQMYTEFFRFPFFVFRPSPGIFVTAGLVSLAAASIGALRGVYGAVALPPAEAMRPPAPPLYRKSGLGSRFVDWFDQPTRMILRHLLRWPARAATTVLGLALALGLLVAAFQWLDSIEHLAHVHFFEAQRQDLTVGLTEPQGRTVLREIEALPGVLSAEPMRVVRARLRSGPRSYREPLQGVPSRGHLAPVYDVSGEARVVPPEGLVLSTELARLLGVGLGDRVLVQVLEGRRPQALIPVTQLFETYIGTPAYIELRALNRLMREPPTVSGVHLRVDSRYLSELYGELKEVPEVSAMTLRRAAVDKFYGTMGETVYIFISFYGAFACAMVFGVTYNTVRINLSERGRELATLRVLGLSAAEISYILLGEMVILTGLSLPLGALAGYGLAWLIVDRFSTELFRVPMVLDASTLGTAVLVTLAAAALSAEAVRQRVARLDLIAVLKTRE